MFHVAAPKYSRLGTPHVVYVSPSHVNGNSQGPEGMHAVYPSRQGGCRDRRDRDRDSQSACPAGLGHAGDTVLRDVGQSGTRVGHIVDLVTSAIG